MAYGIEVRDASGKIKTDSTRRAGREVAYVDISAQITIFNQSWANFNNAYYSVPIIDDPAKFFVIPADPWLHIYITAGQVQVYYEPIILPVGYYDWAFVSATTPIIPIFTY